MYIPFMEIFYVTSNDMKFEEFHDLFQDSTRLNIDLEEIQSLDPDKIIINKLNQAMKVSDKRPLVVDDASLFLEIF